MPADDSGRYRLGDEVAVQPEDGRCDLRATRLGFVD